MDYFKKIERSVTISADKRSTEDLQVDVWSHDLNVTKIILKMDTIDSTAIDLTNATVKVAMAYDQNNQVVKIESDGIVEDVTTQKIACVLDNRLAGFEGTVTVGFYVTLNTGQRIDIQNYKINFKRSLIDTATEEEVQPYFASLDSIVEEARKKLANISDDTEIQNRLTNLEARPIATPYDDTDIINRIVNLENKPDNDTIYDDTDVMRRLAVLEDRGIELPIYMAIQSKMSLEEAIEYAKNVDGTNKIPFILYYLLVKFAATTQDQNLMDILNN